MNTLKADTRLPYLNIAEGDVGVLLAFPLGGLFLAGLLNHDALALPIILCGFFVGVLVVYATPTHLSAATWLGDLWQYAKRPRLVRSSPRSPFDASDHAATDTTEGGLANRTPFTPTTRTEELTHLARAWPGAGAIERTDGTMEAFIELEPGNMDFALSDDWAALQAAGAEFANSDLDHELKLHATTRPFPVEALVDRLDERLTQPDLDENPTFRTLLEEYRDSRPAAMRERGAQELHFYLGVAVNPLSIYELEDGEATPAEKLTRLPGIGFLFNPFVTRRAELTTAERRERQFAALDERVTTLQSELVHSMDGWSARRLTTAEVFALNTTFWNGEEYDATDPLIREFPISGGSQMADSNESALATDPEHDSLEHFHQSAMAPAAVTYETRAAQVGEQLTRTLYIAGFPDYPSDGYLSGLFELTDVQFDCTVHLSPLDQARATETLRETAENAQADAELDRTARSVHLQERAQEDTATYQAVENGQRVFEQAMYLTVRADDSETLAEAVRTVKQTLRDEPATMLPKTAICTQEQALQAAAPLGPDPLERGAIALGGAVGALLASVHSASILEAGGVEFGRHERTQSPVVIDPFARENGYAMFVVGDTGSGKSFSSKQHFLRSMQQREDRIGVILEPLNNWAGVAAAVGGKRVTVGGTRGLNPLEIRPTPEHVQQTMGEDASPFNEKLDDAMSFLTNFFALRDIELGDRRPTVELALKAVYRRCGITTDPATHDRESPTISEMLDVFEEIIDEPESFVVRTDAEAEKLREDAVWLLDQFRPFAEDGRYANLGEPSTFDIHDEKVIYLDLAQQEGSTGGATALTMQLLISLVYERAKETDKEVVFYIDEARYLMQDAASLAFLETVFRHHRHHDLSIRLITQTVDEFFEHPESEAILDQCAVKQFHRLDGMDDHWAEEFGMNYAQMRFVQEAMPGNEETGYSQALVGVDGEWRGIRVKAMEEEARVIDRSH